MYRVKRIHQAGCATTRRGGSWHLELCDDTTFDAQHQHLVEVAVLHAMHLCRVISSTMACLGEPAAVHARHGVILYAGPAGSDLHRHLDACLYSHLVARKPARTSHGFAVVPHLRVIGYRVIRTGIVLVASAALIEAAPGGSAGADACVFKKCFAKLAGGDGHGEGERGPGSGPGPSLQAVHGQRAQRTTPLPCFAVPMRPCARIAADSCPGS